MSELIMTEEGGTPSTPGTGKWKLYPKAEGWHQIDDAGIESPIAANPGYISLGVGGIVRDSVSGYSVPIGKAIVAGTLLSWSSAIARTSLSLSVSTVYYIYLYDNTGTPAVEESTTVPVYNATYDQYVKTGDTSRRCIGSFNTDGSGNINYFVAVCLTSRCVEVMDLNGIQISLVNGGGASTSWQSVNSVVNLNTLMPVVIANFITFNLKVDIASSNDDGIVAVSPVDLGTGVTAANGGWQIRGASFTAGDRFFMGPTAFPIIEDQEYYWKIQAQSGAPTAYIDYKGHRINI